MSSRVLTVALMQHLCGEYGIKPGQISIYLGGAGSPKGPCLVVCVNPGRIIDLDKMPTVFRGYRVFYRVATIARALAFRAAS